MRQPTLPSRSTNPQDYQDVPRPLGVLARDVPDHQITRWHSHKRAQLVYAASGAMLVRTRQATWVIPPQRAVWVPAGVQHETETLGVVAMRTIYIDAKIARRVSLQCCAINVSPLLRELIVRAATLPILYSPRSPEARVMQMILDEIRECSMTPLYLAIPTHPRLAKICAVIMRNPRCHDKLEQLAAAEGMSKRTAERLFSRELSMTFSRWRQQARLLAALTRLAAGKSVKLAAFDSGYTSQSAFTSTFKRVFGTTPTHYFNV
jgi:AraC-like DNA-binding protein